MEQAFSRPQAKGDFIEQRAADEVFAEEGPQGKERLEGDPPTREEDLDFVGLALHGGPPLNGLAPGTGAGRLEPVAQRGRKPQGNI